MAYFLRVVKAEMRKQHLNYFFEKSIYVSLFVWPLLTFITAYYSYKPFRMDRISENIGYVNGQNLIVFVMIGYMSLVFFRCFVQSAWRFSFERTSGTLELIYISPANRLAVIMGNAAASLFESVWLFVVFGAGILLMNRNQLHFQIFAVFLALGLLLVLSMLWGMFLNALFLFSRDSGFLFTILEEPMEIFAGVKIPVPLFPFWAKVISVIFPLTYCAEILRRVCLNGESFQSLSALLYVSIAMGLFMLGATILCLKLGERHAKKTGNMALF